MHIELTEKEKEWVQMNKFRWPLKDGCPPDIKSSVENKKKILDTQNPSQITRG